MTCLDLMVIHPDKVEGSKSSGKNIRESHALLCFNNSYDFCTLW